MSGRVIDVVSGVLVRGPAHAPLVLLSQRGPGSDFAGLWELPGGKVNEGEGHAAAVAREFYEEVGLSVTAGPNPRAIFVYDVCTSHHFRVFMYPVALKQPDEPIAAIPVLKQVVGVGWFPAPFPIGLPIMPSMIAGHGQIVRFARKITFPEGALCRGSSPTGRCSS